MLMLGMNGVIALAHLLPGAWGKTMESFSLPWLEHHDSTSGETTPVACTPAGLANGVYCINTE